MLVGSTAGIFGEAGHADYAAAKSAILGGLLLSLKNEVTRIAPTARVNAVAPGWTVSPMTRGLVDEERIRAISRTMALRKVAQPEDVDSLQPSPDRRGADDAVDARCRAAADQDRQVVMVFHLSMIADGPVRPIADVTRLAPRQMRCSTRFLRCCRSTGNIGLNWSDLSILKP